MQNAVATLYCANPNCQAPNSEQNQFCHRCQAYLPKHYLWAVGSGMTTYQVGDRIAERYLLKGSRVVLDTQPGQPASSLAQVPPTAEPYLKLFPYRLHIPQVYAYVPLADAAQPDRSILLLEQGPISTSDFPPTPGQPNAATAFDLFRPALPIEQAWSQATSLRQLHWLWQMAQLWQPLSSQRVAGSLLKSDLVRVEGPLVRLLELTPDETEATLVQLGYLWFRWVPTAQSAIAPALEQLCQQIVDQQICSAEQIEAQLEEWLGVYGRSQQYQIDIATRSDQGPSRNQNEDACYPPDRTLAVASTEKLTIVCDGVGGHAGGEVASNLAIAAVQQHLQQTNLASLSAKQITTELETAVYHANDLISQRNDQENRQERQRMGTTLVMAFSRDHEVYITHLGDSRAYWITSAGCYQVTLDDDVASREVRLGYIPYREALRQPAAGSLIQALGMGTSALLRPTVQRFILDEDSLFLLCSDGLSDYDRIEESWAEELLPILQGQVDLKTASDRLIQLANQKNGHDNVTIGLVHCRVTQTKEVAKLSAPSFPLVSQVPTHQQTLAPTQLISGRSQRRSVVPLLISLSLLGLLGLLAYLFLPSLLRWWNAQRNSPPEPTTVSPSPVSIPSPTLAVGSFREIQALQNGAAVITPLPVELLDQPDRTTNPKGNLPIGSVIKILGKQTKGGNWTQVKVCSAPPEAPLSQPRPTASATVTSPSLTPQPTPSAPTPSAKPSQSQLRSLTAGTTGWVQEEIILSATTERRSADLGSNQVQACRVKVPGGSSSP